MVMITSNDKQFQETTDNDDSSNDYDHDDGDNTSSKPIYSECRCFCRNPNA